MIWTKTKRALEALLAESVKKRVCYHVTHYGRDHVSYYTRAWVTWDGEEVANFSTPIWWEKMAIVEQQHGLTWEVEGYWDKQRELAKQLSIFSRDSLIHAADAYLNSPIEQSLVSDDTIVRAMVMFDRRVGKRRLAKLVVETEHPLVRKFYELRCEAEGLPHAEAAQ